MFSWWYFVLGHPEQKTVGSIYSSLCFGISGNDHYNFRRLWPIHEVGGVL